MKLSHSLVLGLTSLFLISACSDEALDPSGAPVQTTNDPYGAGGASAVGSSACDNPDDQNVVEANPDLDVDAETPRCVRPWVIAGSGPGSDGFVEGVAECLSENTGLSVACTLCYAQNAECSFQDCGILCLPDPDAADCRDCRCGRTGSVNCFERLEECTGLRTGYCD